MKHLCIFAAVLVCALTDTANGQDNRVFDWTPASGETIPMEPASLHGGRVYHPAAGGGNMHVGIESRYPVTIAMAWADECRCNSLILPESRAIANYYPSFTKGRQNV